jgi:phosphonate transport system substrate-binding protein
MMTRRKLLLGGAALLAAGRASVGAQRRLSIGTTGVFLDDQLAFLDAWKDYIHTRLGWPVAFVQRSSYREITDLILGAQLDFAWVCGPPYVSNRGRVRLAAMPLWRGKPLYQSYVIVSNEDQQTGSILDLGGKIYAFSDPDSNSGWLVPQVELKRAGKDARSFFRKTFFTWAHRRIVEAVGSGLAQGGSTVTSGRP